MDKHIRPIALAYLTTGFSKVATIAVQVVALPFVASTLGANRFGAMLVLASFASLLLIPAQGLAPSLSFGLSTARGEGREDRARQEYWSTIVLATLIATCMLAVAAVVYLLVDLVHLIGPGASIFSDELHAAFFAIAVHVGLVCLASFVEGARAAYQENYVSNLFSMAASITVLCTVALSRFFAPSIGAFYFAIFVVPPLFQAMNLLTFHVRRRAELRRPESITSALRECFGRALYYGLAQIGHVLFLHGTVYLAAIAVSLQAAAIAGGMVRLFILVNSALVSLLNPVLPTISHGVAAGHVKWVQSALRNTIVGAGAAVLAFTMLVGFGGGVILNLWLGIASPSAPGLFPAFGFMAFGFMATYIQNLTLIALGDGAAGGRPILFGGIAALASGMVVTQFAGLRELIAIPSTAMVLIAVLPLSVRLARAAKGATMTARSHSISGGLG